MELLGFLNVDLLLKLVLGLIMLTVGFSLRIKDFGYVLRNKRLLAIGLLLKIVVLPFLAYLLMQFSSLNKTLQFGTMILLLSAGGTTSNVITYWFKGTSALTIFLTTISNLLAVFTIPLLVNYFSILYFDTGTRFSLPVLETTLNIFAIIIIPTIIGVVVHERYPMLAKRFEQFLRPSSVVLLGLVYLIKFFAPAEVGGTGISWLDIQVLLPILLCINFFGMFAGFFVSKGLVLNSRDSMTIGIEMGLQNAAMAILIGGAFLGNEELAKPALLYAMFTFWSTALFALIIRNYYRERNWA